MHHAAGGVEDSATILAAVVGLLAGGVGGALASWKWPLPFWQRARPASGPPDGGPAAGGNAAQERARLVGACADLADRLRERQPALFTVVRRDLESVGVTVRLADGELFDADVHNPVGAEHTDDPGQHLRVAATVRLGYLDHGALTRVPDVIVYRCAGAGDVG